MIYIFRIFDLIINSDVASFSLKRKNSYSFSIIYLLMYPVETKNVAAVTNCQGCPASNQVKF